MEDNKSSVMELTIEQLLQQGVAAHKEGKLQEAERLYRAILKSQPMHPDANHNLGVIAVAVNKANAALPLFKTALESNPKIEQFWLSYIDALINDRLFDNANQVLVQARKRGVDGGKLKSFEEKLTTEAGSTNSAIPSKQQLDVLLDHYQKGRLHDAEELALHITRRFPEHQFGWKVLGAVLEQAGRQSEAVNANQTAVALFPQDAAAHSNLGNTLSELGRLDEAEASYTQAIALKPDFVEACSNLGVTLRELGRLDEAEAIYTQAIALKPDYAEAHYNLGNALQELGRLDEAKASYNQAIALKPNFAVAHSNLGITLQELGRLDEAKASYNQAIALKPDFAEVFWNLHSIQKTIQSAEHWIDKCLDVDENHVKARLTKAALRFYQGDSDSFDGLMQSEFKQHPYMRSFSWAFSLSNLPELYFNKWYFFDALVKKSKVSKPFYEFGVWRASSFKYLIKVFKKGYGFDTFTGLPEDWYDVNGSVAQKAGTYTSDGNVPNIKGGEFIIGKFEDTLPIFFSKNRPTASVINFDADLYSSTICALNFSKSVMDRDTILIFDELLMNENWEQDEFKALNEFCSINHYSYEVIAISFFTKQVAVKLIGI